MRKLNRDIRDYAAAHGIWLWRVAERVGLSDYRLSRLMRRADFPAFRIGRRTLVDRAGLERWVSLQAGAARNSEAAVLERGSRT